jgi:hypothetical protein
MMSIPQTCVNPNNHHPLNTLRTIKNLPISFMPLDKIELGTKKAPETPGLSSLTIDNPNKWTILQANIGLRTPFLTLTPLLGLF